MTLYTRPVISTSRPHYEIVSRDGALPVDMEEVYSFLKLEDASLQDKTEVNRLTESVIELFEGYLFHSIRKKVIRLYYDAYADKVLLPFDPILSVSAVEAGGTAYVLNTDYKLTSGQRKTITFNSAGSDLMIEASVGYEKWLLPADLELGIMKEVMAQYDGENETLSADVRKSISGYNRRIWL